MAKGHKSKMEAKKISNGVQEKILVVDDEESIVELLGYNLKKEGFKVIGALDGEKALDLAKTANPNLIILDLMLPGLHGYEVLRLLKKNMHLSHIPVVILSAKTLEEDIDKGIQLGANDYVTKPFSVAEIVIRVREILERKNLTKS
ncbi:MAG: response regulator [Candidatus Omnitrophica bacterium]|nr:response regulator [Candidatus Omnitrophota bacterium]